MSFRDKISTFLFGSRIKEETDETLREEPAYIPAETAPEPQAAAPDDPSLLELPSDHPIRQLRDLWMEESGQGSALRLCMDEDGVLPAEMIAKEKNRLQSSLKSVCSTRLKAAKGRTRGKHSKKKSEEEEPPEPVALDARPWVYISSDKLYAWMVIFPPVGEGEELTRDMVRESLDESGVSYGLDKAVLDRLVRDRERYFGLYLVARGEPAFDGRNGNIVDYFPRVMERVLEVNEFGQVDYAALNLICNVKEGQEICRLIRPTEGEPGRTVLDQEIPARSGVDVSLPRGRNTEISEDGESLVAAIAGHVEFSNRNFQVKPVLDIEGDVDFSTGNINFVGDVNIKGDVLSGFSVKAMGNISVGGVIESGSTVEAGEDLTVVKGIVGDGTTVVRASGCVFAKYVENTAIYVKENLQTDCIVNGRVYCDGEVVARSGRGSIIGGQIWAAKKISANAVGARSEVKTSVTLGGQPLAEFGREVLRQKVEQMKRELEKLENQLDSPARTSLLGKARIKLSMAELKLKQLEEKLAEQKEQEEKDGGRLECGVAYPGTEITIGAGFLRLRHEARQCVMKLVCDEIVIM